MLQFTAYRIFIMKLMIYLFFIILWIVTIIYSTKKITQKNIAKKTKNWYNIINKRKSRNAKQKLQEGAKTHERFLERTRRKENKQEKNNNININNNTNSNNNKKLI